MVEQAAIVQIEMASVDAQTRITASGLTSEAALAFFEQMPQVKELMPVLSIIG